MLAVRLLILVAIVGGVAFAITRFLTERAYTKLQAERDEAEARAAALAEVIVDGPRGDAANGPDPEEERA